MRAVRVLRAFVLINAVIACTPQPAATQDRAGASASAGSARPLREAVREGDVELFTGGASAGDRRLPLLIALHGLGDNPRDFSQAFVGLRARARVLVLRAPDAYGDGWSWFPARASVSGSEWHRGYVASVDALVARVRAMSAAPEVCGRPVVTGFSQGGMLSFGLAAREAPLSMALPVGGLLPSDLFPRSRVGVPIEAFHGEADARVPIADADRAVAAFNRTGSTATMHRYAGVGHTIAPQEHTEWTAALDRALRQACPNP